MASSAAQRVALNPAPAAPASASDMAPGRCLRLLSYNIQVGIAARHARDYVTNTWRHVLPHAGRFENLDRIAELMHGFDIVALQEADAGSIRSGHVNLVQYLAERAHFPYWHWQTNRRIGRFARHSNGLLARLPVRNVIDHKLPGMLPGRGAIQAFFGDGPDPLVLIVAHLALSRRAQGNQLDYLAELIQGHKHVIVMGDMNCAESRLLERFALRDVSLTPGLAGPATFPSWRPSLQLDHILVSPGIRVHSLHALPHGYSDHLPLAMDIELPPELHLGHVSTPPATTAWTRYE